MSDPRIPSDAPIPGDASLKAAIDIGTNSALLLIAARRGGSLQPVVQRIATPRVGRNLGKTGIISEDSFRALDAALEMFQREIRALGASLVGAVATEAFRKASNGKPLLAKVTQRLGLPCRILSGAEEARLGWLAVHDRHPLPGLAVIDIGAGSTEVTQEAGGTSLPLGAVSLLEALAPAGPAPGDKAVAADCRERALRVFREGLPHPAAPGGAGLVAVGGTASALAMLKLGLRSFDSAAIEGLEMSAAEVGDAIANLEALPPAERAALPGLDPGRAEIIIPGLSILAAYLDFAGIDRFRVSDRGIRYGVILDALENGGSGGAPAGHRPSPRPGAMDWTPGAAP